MANLLQAHQKLLLEPFFGYAATPALAAAAGNYA